MKQLKQFTSIILLVSYFSLPVTSDTPDPDYNLTIEELIVSRGFNYEKHYITTADGYILGVYRLVNPYVDQSARSQLRPIVLQHGLLSSGDTFLINSPGGDARPCQQLTSNYTDNNLGFLLANHCFDVWLSNSRGNHYSRNHTTLDPDKDDEFWKFSVDEMIAYDAPAVIDYILDITGFTSLAWIGHSQGTLIMFGLLSEQPSYSNKVKPFISLAPVFYLQHISMILKLVSDVPGLLWTARKLGGELDLKNLVVKIAEELICSDRLRKPCEYLLYPILGYNMAEVNVSRVDVYRGVTWPGTSVWNIVHLGQNVVSSDGFSKFDYGTAENLIRYSSPTPPKYTLSQINSTSIALLYSNSDDLADKKDVANLIDSIKEPLLRDYFVPELSWNHLDFLHAEDVYLYVNSVVIQILSTVF